MMKLDKKSFAVGVVCSVLVATLGTTAFAAVSGSMTPNRVNIVVNGETISNAGENYALKTGAMVPSSISYVDENGGSTVYLPVRRISEIFGVEIAWDGNINSVIVGEKPSNTETENTANFIGYKEYPTVPDFSEMNPDETTLQEVKTEKDGSATVYVYNGTSGTIGAIPYQRELEEAGFQLVGKFDFDRKWGIVQVGKVDQYKKDGIYVSFGYSPEDTFSVMVSTYQADSSTFFYMKDGEETSTSQTNITYYSRYPSVPDFGAFAGIPESDIGKLAGIDGYYYDIIDVDNAQSKNANLLTDYHNLLSKCGFSYVGEFDGGYGNVECYSDGKYSIGVGIINPRFFAIVVLDK